MDIGDLLPGETNKARQAFEDYFALGPGRSLSKLVGVYRKRTRPAPPTRQLTTLKQWSTRLDWQRRAAARDLEIAKARLEAIKATAIESGYAIYQKRIYDLNSLADLLLQEVNDTKKRWLPDVKQIGVGKDAERINIVRFNSALIEQFRATLNDIALEMGQRVKGLDIGNRDGKPFQIQDIDAARKDRLDKSDQTLTEALAGDDTNNTPNDPVGS